MFNNNMGYIETAIKDGFTNLAQCLITIWDILKHNFSLPEDSEKASLITIWDILKQETTEARNLPVFV